MEVRAPTNRVALLPFCLVGEVPKKALREPCWAGRDRKI
jgi:hypothetical protein